MWQFKKTDVSHSPQLISDNTKIRTGKIPGESQKYFDFIDHLLQKITKLVIISHCYHPVGTYI